MNTETKNYKDHQRLSRLSQYLCNGNYEQAVEMYNKKVQIPTTQHDFLLLAKAYFVLQDYFQTLQILSKISNSRDYSILFQSKVLRIKAAYLSQKKVQNKYFDDLQKLIRRQSNEFSTYHYSILNQIKKVLSKAQSPMYHRQKLSFQHKQFLRMYKQNDSCSQIMQGMPAYLISQRWFSQWEKYLRSQTTTSPGIITHWQILDHIANGWQDQRKSKIYTNMYLFDKAKYILLPKQCWQFLNERYSGNQIIRYNIATTINSHEVDTQVLLKKISVFYSESDNINKIDPNLIHIVQITKRQTWKGLLTNKIEPKWGQISSIIQVNENRTKQIEISQFLQNFDTIGKVYICISAKKSSSQNISQNNEALKCGSKKCKKTQQLRFCQCKSIRYCSMQCLKQDRDLHRKKCDISLAHIKQKSAIIQNFELQQRNYGGMKGLVGLTNLGNTCYMNSGLQCLSNTKELTQYFMSNQFLQHINEINPLGAKGNLACAYAELIRKIWTENSQSVSPFKMKKMIGQYAGQFSGFGQQDSQQFISYLIDGLQEDLNLVKNKQTFETKDQIVPDEQASLQRQQNDAKRIQSTVRDLMVGQFKSTVKCLQCQKISICFDPYLIISLPIPTLKVLTLYLLTDNLQVCAIKLQFDIDESLSLQTLQKHILKEYDQIQDLVFATLDKNSFQMVQVINDLQRLVLNCMNNQVILFAYQIPRVDNTQQLYIAEFYHRNQRCSYFRFLKFPKKSSNYYQKQIIQKVYKRLDSGSFNQVVKKYSKQKCPAPYNQLSKNYLFVQFFKNQKLLSFKSNTSFRINTRQSSISILDCLSCYSRTQLLQKQNECYCSKCKKHTKAQKKIEIYKTNKILVLSLKRFTRMRKINTHVDVDLNGVEIGNFLISNKNAAKIYYDLYAVVNHYGSLGGGHYTASCKNFINNRWFQFNDSRVSEIRPTQVISSASYVLFFRRRD